jgi:hypothetical protein
MVTLIVVFAVFFVFRDANAMASYFTKLTYTGFVVYILDIIREPYQ